MDLGTITNYKYYEDPADQTDGWHFYEINHKDSDNNYYIKSKEGDPVAFGTDIRLDIVRKKAYIRDREYLIEGPFSKFVHTVNYQGFVLDCIDSDFGFYNLDNEILLFGSGCIDFPVGASVTLFNLHLVTLTDSAWIYKLFGSSLKKSSHLLVYCPAFSSYIETGCNEVAYDNIIKLKSDLYSQIISWHWLKTQFSSEIPFPGFQSVDELAHCLYSASNSNEESRFIGHCENCILTSSNFDHTSAMRLPKPITAADIKSTFHTERSNATNQSASSSSNNETVTRITWLRNEVVCGVLNKKNPHLFELTSGDKKVPLFAPDLNISDGSFALIFNAVGVLEIIPNLHYPDMPTVKAYLWLSPDSKVWASPEVDTNLRSISQFSEENHVLCRIVRKYSILKQFEGSKIAETSVIQVESHLGSRSFYLNPDEKYYTIVCDDSRDNGPMAIRHYITKLMFQESHGPIFLPSDSIVPTLRCTLSANASTGSKGPLQVRLSDLPYLKLVPGLQFFALKLQFYPPVSLKFQLNCGMCKALVEGGRCLIHREGFSPSILVNGVFEVSDQSGTQTTILMDNFAHLEIIYSFKPDSRDKLINILKRVGKLNLSGDDLSFERLLKQPAELESMENIVAAMLPRISRPFLCTFNANMANSALKPIKIELLNIKLELINILKMLS